MITNMLLAEALDSNVSKGGPGSGPQGSEGAKKDAKEAGKKAEKLTAIASKTLNNFDFLAASAAHSDAAGKYASIGQNRAVDYHNQQAGYMKQNQPRQSFDRIMP